MMHMVMEERNYRAPRKSLYMVARNFFMPLLNCSAWLLLNKISLLFPGPLYKLLV